MVTDWIISLIQQGYGGRQQVEFEGEIYFTSAFMARLYDILRPYDIQETYQEHEFTQAFQTVATQTGKHQDANRINRAKILKHHCPARLVKAFLRQMLGSFVHLLSELHLEPEDASKPIARIVSGECIDRASGVQPQTDLKYIN